MILFYFQLPQLPVLLLSSTTPVLLEIIACAYKIIKTVSFAEQKWDCKSVHLTRHKIGRLTTPCECNEYFSPTAPPPKENVTPPYIFNKNDRNDIFCHFTLNFEKFSLFCTVTETGNMKSSRVFAFSLGNYSLNLYQIYAKLILKTVNLFALQMYTTM